MGNPLKVGIIFNFCIESIIKEEVNSTLNLPQH